MSNNIENLIHIPVNSVSLEGVLAIPKGAKSLVIFAHGSGSSRHSSRNNYVAKVLQEAGIATFLFDLLTEEEDLDYEKHFEIPLLSERLEFVTAWIKKQKNFGNFKIGYFGASTGAAAAIEAAANLKLDIGAVVSRGGRPDMARLELISKVKAPILLIVGGDDIEVFELNELAKKSITAENELLTIPGATHLFEESGTLEKAAELARDWFLKYL